MAISEIFIPRGNVTFLSNVAYAETTYIWNVPEGVTSISAVLVGPGGGGIVSGGAASLYSSGGGGGGLAYKNNIPVTPGESITVTIGRPGVKNQGFTSYTSTATNIVFSGRSGFQYIQADGGQNGDAGRAGGTGSSGGISGGDTTVIYQGGAGGPSSGTNGGLGGGGGAAGYSGNGGVGGSTGNGASGSGGGGGGGGALINGGNSVLLAAGGGGVGLFGEGTSGAGGAGYTPGPNQISTGGSGGSGGDIGSYGGGNFGGGSGGSHTTSTGSFGSSGGGPGAVRIIWGNNRSFPSTNVADTTSGTDATGTYRYDFSASGGLTFTGGLQLKMLNTYAIPHGEYTLNGPWTQYVSTSLSDYVGTWTVPANVYSISYVLVGPGGNGSKTLSYGIGYAGSGAGLAYRNNVPVTPGQTVSIVMSASGGFSPNVSITVNGETTTALGGITGGGAAGYSGYVDGGGFGGAAGTGSFVSASGGLAGGGGAGGYNGTGGAGGGHNGSSFVNATAGQAGGAGGGGQFNGNSPLAAGWGGGGVGLYGIGGNGLAGTSGSNTGGGGGSGGDAGDGGSALYGFGGSYGGGAAGVKNSDGSIEARRGGFSGLRIVWGYNRKFPSTNVSDNTTGTDTFIA